MEFHPTPYSRTQSFQDRHREGTKQSGILAWPADGRYPLANARHATAHRAAYLNGHTTFSVSIQIGSTQRGFIVTRNLLLSAALFAIVVPTFADEPLRSVAAREILQRALSAAGGERTLARLKGPALWMKTGTFYGMGEGQPFVAQYATKWPNWYREEIEGAFVITANGDKVWASSANGVRVLEGDLLRERLGQIKADWAMMMFPLTDRSYKLSRIDSIEVGGRATVGIKVSHSDHRDLKFYFDHESYRIAKYESTMIVPEHGTEPVPAEWFCESHGAFVGALPSKIKLIVNRKLYIEMETVAVKLGATVDPGFFEFPE